MLALLCDEPPRLEADYPEPVRTPGEALIQLRVAGVCDTDLQLADILRTEKPSLAVILTTGFSDEVLKSGTGGRAVVLKPYRLETLTEAIDEALAGR